MQTNTDFGCDSQRNKYYQVRWKRDLLVAKESLACTKHFKAMGFISLTSYIILYASFSIAAAQENPILPNMPKEEPVISENASFPSRNSINVRETTVTDFGDIKDQMRSFSNDTGADVAWSIPTTTTTTNSTEVIEQASDIHQELINSSPRNSYSGLSSSCMNMTNDRLCGCTPGCARINNCCYDSEFGFDSPNSDIKHSCYTDLDNKWTLSEPSVLVDGCALDWTDESTRRLCEEPNPEDFRSHVPCYSHQSALSYKNWFCLKCNYLDEDYVPWTVTFQSAISMDFTWIDTFEKMNDAAGRPLYFRGNQFVVSPGSDKEPVHCVPGIVGRCSPKFTTQVLSKSCAAYYSPVLVDGTFYRNMHCFKCSTGRQEGDSQQTTVRRLSTPLSILLNMNGQQNHQDISHCTGKSCLPTIERIRGYAMSQTRYVLTKVTGTPKLTSDRIVQMNYQLISLLRASVELRLKSINMTARASARGYNSRVLFIDKKSPVILGVRIMDEISITDIPSVQKLISSVGFNLSVYNDTVHFSCCFDEDDDQKLTGSPDSINVTTADVKPGVNTVERTSSGLRSNYEHCLSTSSFILVFVTFGILVLA